MLKFRKGKHSALFDWNVHQHQCISISKSVSVQQQQCISISASALVHQKAYLLIQNLVSIHIEHVEHLAEVVLRLAITEEVEENQHCGHGCKVI